MAVMAVVGDAGRMMVMVMMVVVVMCDDPSRNLPPKPVLPY